ncbi:chromatin assembly factor 1 subunit A-like [Cynocephalus volans]|uniref:chromatin assembly factor 1 subunit A-like n=1 Tax=Cynocephalus volans TaxID=110931 RepID=UPI002FCAF321
MYWPLLGIHNLAYLWQTCLDQPIPAGKFQNACPSQSWAQRNSSALLPGVCDLLSILATSPTLAEEQPNVTTPASEIKAPVVTPWTPYRVSHFSLGSTECTSTPASLFTENVPYHTQPDHLSLPESRAPLRLEAGSPDVSWARAGPAGACRLLRPSAGRARGTGRLRRTQEDIQRITKKNKKEEGGKKEERKEEMKKEEGKKEGKEGRVGGREKERKEERKEAS